MLGRVVLHEFDEQSPQRGVAEVLQFVSQPLEFTGVISFGLEQLRHEDEPIPSRSALRPCREVVEDLMVAVFVGHDQTCQMAERGGP